MFPQFKKINNESGLVLFIVLMTAIIIMIFSLGILTQSMNEINYAQQQIDQLTSQEWSKGMFWNAYSSTNCTKNETYNIDLNGRNYIADLTETTDNATANYCNVTTNYDTFQ